MRSAVSICVIYPDLLGTYGDGGNAIVLERRLQWRGIAAETKLVDLGEDVPSGCDIYLLGGGEDQPQISVTERLAESGALHRAVDSGAVVFGVCAGMQILGNSFHGPQDSTCKGLELIDIDTRRGDGPRRVGELATRSLFEPSGVAYTGYENHQGITTLGKDAQPLATVTSGIGNDDGQRTEGAVTNKVVTTYMHGPALVRNPTLADRLLEMTIGQTLEPLDDREVDELRAHRLRAAKSEAGAGSASQGLVSKIKNLF